MSAMIRTVMCLAVIGLGIFLDETTPCAFAACDAACRSRLYFHDCKTGNCVRFSNFMCLNFFFNQLAFPQAGDTGSACADTGFFVTMWVDDSGDCNDSCSCLTGTDYIEVVFATSTTGTMIALYQCQ
jgi:hypothetical protein